MLDIKYIRENKEIVEKGIKDKQLSSTVDLNKLLNLDSQIRELRTKIDRLRSERNKLDESIKFTQIQSERDAFIKKATELKSEIQSLESESKPLEDEFNELMLWVPNPPAIDVPYGTGEDGNVVVRRVGEIKNFDFQPKDHSELGVNLGIIDTTRGAKIGGFRSYFLVGDGMLLEQALLQYALSHMVKLGFTPMNVPVMVDKQWLVGTGYFPWGEEDHYYTQDGLGLVGTAEVSLTAYYAGETLNETDLPIKLTGLSPCFRREVGSHGKDTKGVFRVHYFNKVEQVVLIPADESLSVEWHDIMLGYSEEILKGLKLPYEVLLMCSGDMGAGQRKKYDIQTWFPSQKKYRETHSDSYFNDFQSRRLNIKYRTKDGDTKYVYTLNNTVAASTRLLAAVMENYQNSDGSIIVPDVLRKYMDKDIIKLDK